MPKFSLLLALLGLLCFTDCSTTKSAETDAERMVRQERARSRNPNDVRVDAAQTGMDLTQYLRRIPGVQVRGSGPSATIRIRDSRSVSSDTTPLFVVNGTILGNSFANLYSTIDVNEIKRVRVLKSASETNRYGLQGGNGVFEITLKD